MQDTLDGLEFHLGRLLSQLKRPDAHHVLTRRRLEPQLDLPLRLRLPRHLGVVDETVAGPRVRGQLAGAAQLQALDYRGFAGAVGADDEGQGLEEGDDELVLRVEAPDALDQHLVHRAHLRRRPPPAAAAPPTKERPSRPPSLPHEPLK